MLKITKEYFFIYENQKIYNYIHCNRSLLDGLKDPILKEWRDVIKIQQHWIGECTGINIDFLLDTDNGKYPRVLTLWTDKPEFIEHAKFLAISRNNLFAQIEEVKNETSIRKLNVRAINPFTNELLPVYITEKGTFYSSILFIFILFI